MTIQVTVAIPTFRRNRHISELVPLLLTEIEELEGVGDYRTRVLVIDNDPAGGAAPLLEGMAHPCLEYVHEPSPGLAAVRNRALGESMDSRILVFMDDDGRPAAGWLRLLMETWEVGRPAAVAGRVLEEYETDPDPWIVAGRFFRRRSLPTGTEVPAAPAGNLLLDLDFVRERGLSFDDRFGLSGGEDTLFTRQLCAAGGRIVWCDESRVVDQVRTSRLNRRWVLARSWSHGNTATLVDLAMATSVGTSSLVRGRALLGGVVRVLGGAVRYVLGLVVCSERHQSRGLRATFRGAGMVSGALGHVVQEYSR